MLFSRLCLLRAWLHISAPLRRRLKARRLDRLNKILRQRLPDSGFCVIVGANDGRRSDALNRFLDERPQWHGILIEPVPPLFERLKANFPDASRFMCINIAISDRCGTAQIHFLDEGGAAMLGLPAWWDQIASLGPTHIVKHFGDEVRPFIRTAEVSCDTLETVVRRHWSGPVDLILVDAEGEDFRIISRPEFHRFSSPLIIFEHCHMTRSERKSCTSLLLNSGYSVETIGRDTIAWRRDVEASGQCPVNGSRAPAAASAAGNALPNLS